MSDLVFSDGYTNAPVPNRERHASTIAAWQLAQTSPPTLTAYTHNLHGYCTWLDAMGFDLLTVRRVHPPVEYETHHRTHTNDPTSPHRDFHASIKPGA